MTPFTVHFDTFSPIFVP